VFLWLKRRSHVEKALEADKISHTASGVSASGHSTSELRTLTLYDLISRTSPAREWRPLLLAMPQYRHSVCREASSPTGSMSRLSMDC
jgi:hypothetical protein